MSSPTVFTTASPRFGLPLLFAGQAQKEFFVNQAHAIADSLLHPAITGRGTAPPANPDAGESWLVESGAIGDWLGHDDSLASWQAGVWIFPAPTEGMRLFDTLTGQFLLFRSGAWRSATAPAEPAGGANVDTEARNAIIDLIENLRVAGILPSN
ncbi:DUF2793 domain-containing protein [Sphingomonadaceae bacterium]|nr:DUF2793 domain-containing protein [Sphingomonadaceae bacterium]